MRTPKFRQSIHTDPYVAVRSFLKEKKEQAGLTNRSLGSKLGTAYSLVQKVESGDRRLDVVEACKYCLTLGVDPHELVDLILEELEE